MSSLDTRLERIDDIERKLARRPTGWTSGELAREYGVDPSTIFRDLAVLEARGTGLIKQGRRYILDHRSSFHLLKLYCTERGLSYPAWPNRWNFSVISDVSSSA